MTALLVPLDQDRLAPLRRAVLEPGTLHPAPAAPLLAPDPAVLAAAAAETGVALAVLPRPLSPAEFCALGAELGEPMVESAPAVQSRVTAGRILNLVTELPATTDVDVQPFAAGSLLMHTESSARPPAEQPRHLLFQCLAAAHAPADGQTVVVPADAVADRLGPERVELLGRLRYRGAAHSLARREGGRVVFSFRDPGTAPLALDHTGAEPAAEVTAAVDDLCAAVYQSAHARSVPWRVGLLVLLDNHRVFHGRTRSTAVATGRHLQRLRITSRSR
ncbi:TauD/TfdA family dioxygenase [Kitasatospora sp. NPDC058063]|uniref:TauD/TfdA family dioxygenase n=1 Tax=unclassified Kitasatospora TaxID=2633591 RepID=UPI0036DCD92C